jgi:cardiolipin synthase
MRRLFLFLILLIPGHCVALQIIEFCPDPYLANDPDEYLVLEGTQSLDGVTVSDGEGGFRFPPGTSIAGRLTIARDGEAYARTHGKMPDYEWYDHSPQVPDVIRNGNLQLSNTGDQLLLFQDGLLLQDLVWPGELAARQGQVHYLQDGVWDRRPLMIGQSRFEPAEFEGVSGISFVSPDCSLEVYTSFVDSAEQELLVNVYEFSSPTMSGELIEARERGVLVTVLLEGGPVGGISDEEKTVIASLRDAGIPVYFMSGSDTAHVPYRYDHAKYLVADGKQVLVTSENFKPTGFPKKDKSGNRGWGVVLDDPQVAGYFSRVFHYDCGGGWTVPAEGEILPEDILATSAYRREFDPLRFSGATVIPVLAPDTGYLIEDMISGAAESIDIEQAYITNQSDGSLNPFLEAAVEAAERGVRVRILLDSSYFNIEEDYDNDEMVRTINNLADDRQLPLAARCADLEGNNLEKIHNKGVIIDRRSVLVSSINWNTNSPQFNREAGVIIVHPDVGAYFTGVFEDDWNRAATHPGSEGPDPEKVALAAVVVLILTFLFIWRKKKKF